MDGREASCTLCDDEMTWAASKVYSRVAKAPIHTRLYMTLATLGGTMSGVVIALVISIFFSAYQMATYWPVTLAVFLLLTALGTVWGVGRGWKKISILLDKAWREGLVKRGVPPEVEARYALREDGIEFTTGRLTALATYASIHEILHDDPYWIIAADGQTLCLPDRAFASAQEAEAFLQLLWQRIDQPSRDRSRLTGLRLD